MHPKGGLPLLAPEVAVQCTTAQHTTVEHPLVILVQEQILALETG